MKGAIDDVIVFNDTDTYIVPGPTPFFSALPAFQQILYSGRLSKLNFILNGNHNV